MGLNYDVLMRKKRDKIMETVDTPGLDMGSLSTDSTQGEGRYFV